MKRIRILLIEDNRILRDGIKAAIDGEPDMMVVAASGGFDVTMLQMRAPKPQVALLDLSLRGQNGMRVVSALTKGVPGLKVIGMGLSPSQLDVIESVEAGASGFILKDATKEAFLETIRSVSRGEKVLPHLLAGSLFSHVVGHALKNAKRDLSYEARMTKREREVVALIADGLSNKGIAKRLSIATYTVKSHVHNILEKMALHTRLQVAKSAYRDEAS